MMQASLLFNSLRFEAKVLLFMISLISFLFLFRSSNVTYQIAPYGTIRTPCDNKFNISKPEAISWHPRIFRYENFLSEEECDYIRNKGINQGLERSKVAAPGNSTENVARTSYGAFLEDDGDIVVRSIEHRISQWIQYPIEHGEQIYLLRYEEGQEYKPHHDFFHRTLEGVERYLDVSGQRTATVLMYIEAPLAGGETYFPAVNITEPVKKGNAILFFSTIPDTTEDFDSLHGSYPVINGTKWCATKWIRINKHHDRIPLPKV